jgi:hypothetical protein
LYVQAVLWSDRKEWKQLDSTEEITSDSTRMHLPIITRQNEKYRYVFDQLSDQCYTQPFQANSLQIEQTVHAITIVAFRSRSPILY